MEPSISLRCPPGDEGLQPPVRVVRLFEGSGRFLSCHADVLLSRFSPPHHSASGWFPSALGRATVRPGQFSRGIVDPKRIIPVTTVLGFAWTCKVHIRANSLQKPCFGPNFLLLKFRSN